MDDLWQPIRFDREMIVKYDRPGPRYTSYPTVLGLGCDTMATMTTRILETRKERVVTTMLLALAVPCSAQLGVLLAMMTSLSPVAAVAWMGLMVMIILLVGSLTARAFPGETGDFILEIPPMRRPQTSWSSGPERPPVIN